MVDMTTNYKQQSSNSYEIYEITICLQGQLVIQFFVIVMVIITAVRVRREEEERTEIPLVS